jgi:hypothetical protein
MKINRRACVLILLVGIASPIRTAPMMAQGDHRDHDAAVPGSIEGRESAATLERS